MLNPACPLLVGLRAIDDDPLNNSISFLVMCLSLLTLGCELRDEEG